MSLAGLGSEGQISQQLLRRALAAVGVHSPTLGDQIAETFATLDPEQTGTISFLELHGELRRVRKLLQPQGGYGQGSAAGGGGKRGLARGGSASTMRGAALSGGSGFRHEDGVPYSASELEQAAANFRRQGELGQALRALEAALASHVRVHGERSDVAMECSRQVADVCNSLGMQMLQRDDFVRHRPITDALHLVRALSVACPHEFRRVPLTHGLRRLSAVCGGAGGLPRAATPRAGAWAGRPRDVRHHAQ